VREPRPEKPTTVLFVVLLNVPPETSIEPTEPASLPRYVLTAVTEPPEIRMEPVPEKPRTRLAEPAKVPPLIVALPELPALYPK
jgi:hypothetical protein